jgi:hypothetical protein
MAPGRPDLRWAAKVRASAAFCLVGAVAGTGLYFGNLAYVRAGTPFHVTGVVITQQTRTGCRVDVTGRITTNGSAGTVSYRWLFRPGQQAPQPLSQSVAAGQKAVDVTVAVEGQGHGTASQTVTLHVLGPDPRAASTPVVVSCG